MVQVSRIWRVCIFSSNSVMGRRTISMSASSWSRSCRRGAEFFGDEDVLALARETGEEAGLCAQLAARELFGIVAFGFPSTLRQLERALADGVAVLFDEPDVIAVDGKDGGAVILVDDAIDAASAVRAFDLVFAKA